MMADSPTGPDPANVRFGMLSPWNSRARRAAQASNTSGPGRTARERALGRPSACLPTSARASNAAQATNAPADARRHPGSAPSHARRRGHTRSRRRCRPSAPLWNAPARYAGRPSSGRSSNCLRSTTAPARAVPRPTCGSSRPRRANGERRRRSSSPASSRELVPVGTVRHRTYRGVVRAWVKVAEPKKWRQRALVNWEAANGPLPKGKLVHHKDRNPLNDDPSNLQALTRAEHLAEHRDEHRRAHATSPNSVG